MKTLKAITISAALMVSGTAAASEVIATLESSKSGGVRSFLTVATDGTEEGISFVMQLPKGVAPANLTSCASLVPQGVVGRCGYSPETNKLAVVLFRLDREPLPAGVLSIGSVEFKGDASAIRAMQIEQGTAKARGGTATPLKTTIEGLGHPGNRQVRQDRVK